MSIGTAVIVPIAVVVVLPVLIVWLIARVKINNDNRRSEALLEAIRQGSNVDADRLTKFFSRENRTPAELLNLRLLRGSIFTLLGVALCVVSIVTDYVGIAGSDGILGFAVTSAVAFAIGVGYLIVYFVSRPKRTSDATMTREQFTAYVVESQKAPKRFLTALCCGDSTLADDIAQETYMKAYLSADSFRDSSKFQAWVNRIAYNTYISHMRSARKTVGIEHAECIRADEAERACRYRGLYAALARLSGKERTAILLFYLEGYRVKGNQ